MLTIDHSHALAVLSQILSEHDLYTIMDCAGALHATRTTQGRYQQYPLGTGLSAPYRLHW
jgi:hypothetical protein